MNELTPNEQKLIKKPNLFILAFLIKRTIISNNIWILHFENFQMEAIRPFSHEVLKFLDEEWKNNYSNPVIVEISFFSSLSTIEILKSDPLYQKYLVYQIMNS